MVLRWLSPRRTDRIGVGVPSGVLRTYGVSGELLVPRTRLDGPPRSVTDSERSRTGVGKSPSFDGRGVGRNPSCVFNTGLNTRRFKDTTWDWEPWSLTLINLYPANVSTSSILLQWSHP